MNISVISVFSHLYTPFLQTSLIARAQEQGLVSISVHEYRSFVEPKERIDGPTFGHGAGMLIRPEVVERSVTALEQKQGKAYKIFFSPHGKKITQNDLHTMLKKAQQCDHLMLLPARYEGMDARVEQEYADEIVSIGDFVLMDGDLPAMMLLEGMLRLIPGVVGRQESVHAESFSGPFVDYPEYTQPVVWHTQEVPPVLRSGDHAAIQTWRENAAIERTIKGHFQWLRSCFLSEKQKAKVLSKIPSHYVVLMHSNVIVGDGSKTGTTSVTSLDMHDIARSCKTYGIGNYFLVTPLVDQQKIVRTLLDFWQTGDGVEYNASRHEAVKSVELMADIESVMAFIERKEGKKPLVVVTSARSMEHKASISFYDQEIVWAADRPVLLVFGTGKGLAEEYIKKADYVLVPVQGLSSYNHLSVRSAVAIILDRWLGLNPQHNSNLSKE